MYDQWYDCQDTTTIINGTNTLVSMCPLWSDDIDYIRCSASGLARVDWTQNCIPREYSGSYYVEELLGMDYEVRWTNWVILMFLGVGFRLLGFGALVKNNGW
jgi:hypothetical protein